MRTHLIIALSLLASFISSVAQNSATSVSELPKDPRVLLAGAKPLYAYNDSALRPWHLVGTYQIFDHAGNPAQHGTYEFWWEKPGVYRSSWSRAGSTRSEWHTEDGNAFQQSSGDRLFYFEHAIESLVFSPVPDLASLDQGGFEIKRDRMSIGKIELPCVEIKAHARSDAKFPFLPGVQPGSYCFDPHLPILRIEHQFNSIYIEFNQLTIRQNHVIPREISITDSRHKLLTFSLETISDWADDAGTIKPPSSGEPFLSADRVLPYEEGKLQNKIPPVYPQAAKAQRISGTVILDAMIGSDGGVTDIRVLSGPSPLLTTASKDAVAQWRYSPRLLDGRPQEVDSIINVIFSLGY
jgi:TonB family protein